MRARVAHLPRIESTVSRDETGTIPMLFRLANGENEILQNLGPKFGVQHFRMKFHSIELRAQRSQSPRPH